jgi:membrane protease subunit (stomatin/prohibitin family)
MPDREKVINELVEHIESALSVDSDYVDCVRTDLLQYTVALLKEQEEVKPKSKSRHGANAQIQHFCGNCNSMLHGKPKFCSECGKGVLW